MAAAAISALGFTAGPSVASPLAGGLTSGAVPQLNEGLVQKVHGWHCRRRYGWYHGHKVWHRHRRACYDDDYDNYDNYDDYWKNFMIFSKHMTLSRTLRALTIMGRTEKEKLDFSQLMYPSMQSADIKALDLDIVHAGMDQRKIHMLVREIFPKLGWKVPVSVHQHLLPGLTEPTKFGLGEGDEQDYRISSKMSKTNPLGGVSIHDNESTIQNKISRAYCPIGESENNPMLEITKYVIFHKFPEFQIERPSKYGGNMVYDDYKKLEYDYIQKKIHPKDLRDSVSIYLNKVIEPVRNHFKNMTILEDL